MYSKTSGFPRSSTRSMLCAAANSRAAGSISSASSCQYGSGFLNPFAMVAALSFTPLPSSQRLMALLLMRLEAS